MFTTKVELKPSEFKIDYDSKIVTLGSCFSENIGTKLRNACFDIDVNPFGVLFNPISIKQSIDILLYKNTYSELDLFQFNSLWNSFSHSSLFSNFDKNVCLEKINLKLSDSKYYLNMADYLIITFGSAWVYKLVETGQVVSNCHKLPASTFVRHRLTVDEILAEYTEIIHKLLRDSPALKIIFSVSPVRHWKDGPTENNISKGILLQAIQELGTKFSNVIYFPAYEIQVDELRDYRYYASDMLHPSELAVDYIFNCFKTCFFNSETNLMFDEICQFLKSSHHRPLHINTPNYLQFVEALELKKQALIKKYRFLNKRLNAMTD